MKIIYKEYPEDNDTRGDKKVRYIYTAGLSGLPIIGDLKNIPKTMNKPKHKNRVAQILWSKPAKEHFKTARWNIGNQLELTLPLASLSLAMLKELGQEVVLYTDTDGVKLLGNLPYDRVYNIFDKLNVKNDFWACGKIIALENEPLDSVLVDTDIFVYDGAILDKAFENDVIGSHEENTIAYRELVKFAQSNFPHLRGNQKKSTNTGFMKIAEMHTKQNFIQTYWKVVKKFSDQKLLDDLETLGQGAYCPDLIAEQLNFHRLCKPKKLIELEDDWRNAKGFVHPLSMTKYIIIPEVLEILKTKYPDYYKMTLEIWERHNFEVEYNG